MKVTLIPCSPPANESELKAFEHIKTRLLSIPGEDEWILLTNLAFSVTHQLQSDEIDLISIGPPGVRVIEIKHWDAKWINKNPDIIDHEADRISFKARKIGTTLRKIFPDLPVVEGLFLLTRENDKLKTQNIGKIRGVSFFSLNQWQELLQLDNKDITDALMIKKMGKLLAPKCSTAIDGSLRRLAGHVNLELQTPKDNRFHRIYRGVQSARQDKVILHLYDLSATDEKNAENTAKREFEALHLMQIYPWAPRILDSYQDAPGFTGEMFFFTTVDPAIPSIQKRADDVEWKTDDKISFARQTAEAVRQLHEIGTDDSPIFHRNLSPMSILVKHDNTPVITDFNLAKIPSDTSIVTTSFSPNSSYIAPEVVKNGLIVANRKSDVYSLCSALTILFSDQTDSRSQQILKILETGMTESPNDRVTLCDLEAMFSQFLGELPPLPPAPPARFWTEDQIVRFKKRDYRIVTRLGSGGVGITFKVVEIDHINHEEIGSYVAKVAHNKNIGERAIKAYSLVRPHLGRHPNLSTIFEVANECYENQILSIMTWIEGSPLSDFIGVLPLLAEDQQDESTLHLIKRWLQDILTGLSILHKNGLIHGDVSPKNLIVSGSDLVLTDYDFITKVGDSAIGPATEMYCAMSCMNKEPVSPADDIYALAASFFHVLFEKEPFQNKHSGLSWENIDVSEMSDLTDFMNQATNPDPKKRFRSTSDALAALKVLGVNTQIDIIQNEIQKEDVTNNDITVIQIKPEPRPDIKLTNQKVTWLLSLLQSYPGSCWGNQETRGLDSSFATSTYVPTKLEDELFGDIENQRVRLVILCGNAGDGKTALLQHLADRLGLGEHHSSNRIFEGKLKNRSLVRMNLDGSAAWNGRSADELMDEFLAPFQNGPPKEDIVHLLAINDGRLLEWIENQDKTPLIIQLNAFLQDIQPEKGSDSYIKFINLNHRSLVGGIQADRKNIQILFLGRLLDQLYGGDKSPEIWAPCDSCTAKKRCEVVRAASIFGPETLPYSADIKTRSHARKRLYDALQAVHLKGETHITIRELRSTLVYILFGIHYCQDYHNGLPEGVLPYWDRVFMPEASGRQGELLHELPFFDPALEAHPKIDRYLINNLNQENPSIFPHYDSIALESARRRAYFEWDLNHIRNVAKQRDNEHGALDLAKGRYLSLFKKIPLENEEMNGIKRDKICAQLCKGISRLEDLPYRAFDRKNCVPLRITPKTPTETAFWVEKPLTNFCIYPDIPNREKGIDLLHRHIFLVYKYRNGQEEKLRIGADLFYLLLELGDGYQLGDASSEDTFANLSIFVQRLVREDEHELMAWNPIDESNLYKITAKMDVKKEGTNQQFVLNRLE